MYDPVRSSPAEAARSIRAGTVTASVIVAACLERIEAIDGPLSAVVPRAADTARAREADAALARGEVWGPLHGVPMTIKHPFETEGAG